MHIVIFIIISVCLHYNSANTSFEDCTASPYSLTGANAPLADLQGIWYVYDTSRSAWVPRLRCGACRVYQKPTGTYKMQCILQDNRYETGQLKKFFIYLTGTLTKSATHVYTFSPAQGSQDGTFVVTTWADKNSPMAVTLCQLMDLGFMKFRYTYVVELARKGPVTADAQEVDHKETCLDIVFDPSEDDGEENAPGCCVATTRPTGNLPVTDCTQEGWIKQGSLWYKLMPLKKSWSEAKQICQDLGYVLAKIDTDALLTFVKNSLLTDENCQEAWVGLSHVSHPSTAAARAATGAVGTYKWCPDAATFEVTLANGAPDKWCKRHDMDDGSEHWDKTEDKDARSCFTLDKVVCTEFFGWKERLCSVTLPFICQRTAPCPSLTL